jgi:membrane protein YdbS with pleckstrin-like domain
MDVDSTDSVEQYPAKVYPSKRDRWIVGLLWLIIAFCVASMVYIFYTVTSIAVIIAQESLFLVLDAFCLSILRNTYYVLEDDYLLIRSGWFRWRTPFIDILEVTPSRKIWSSAALSMDRLYVRHRKLPSSSYISPEDKEGFLRDLASRSNQLVFQGDRVVRNDDLDHNPERELI